MALDPEKYKNSRSNIEQIAERAPIDDEDSKKVMNEFLDKALGEVEDLIDESRPPRLYIFGRSGAGKSSLINALSKKEVADIGAVEPTTVDSTMYHIPFSDRYASWDVVDSRGLFESVAPDGSIPEDTVEKLKEDLEEYRPDILIHMMTPDQVRAGKQDFETVEELRDALGDRFPPVLYCLNKVDTHMAPSDEWPPEENPELAGDIKSNLDFVSDLLGEQDREPFMENKPLYGYEFDSNQHIGVIPVHLMDTPYWNVNILSWMIADFLPDDARLQFAQAQRRDQVMQRFSRDVTNRFSAIAGGVGAYPAPVADMAVLSGLQLLLVGLIGSFSCEELERETVEDYITAMGGTVAAGYVARSTFRSLAQLVPGFGTAISTGVAAGGTWTIGRSAEEYFFNDEIKKPSSFATEAKERFQGQ